MANLVAFDRLTVSEKELCQLPLTQVVQQIAATTVRSDSGVEPTSCDGRSGEEAPLDRSVRRFLATTTEYVLRAANDAHPPSVGVVGVIVMIDRATQSELRTGVPTGRLRAAVLT